MMTIMRACMFILVFLAAVTASAVNGQDAGALSWMDKNAKTFAQMVKTLGITPKTFSANTVGTLLVPSDKAIAAFLAGMQLTPKEFLSRKQLVDLVVSYHFIPRHQAKNVNDVPSNPTVAVTADVNYILRFYRNAAKNSVWVQDVQGSNVTLTQKPVIINNISIIPIDTVLMSGGYFFSGLAALKHYPQWADAFKLAEQAGWPIDADAGDITMFVPDNAALLGRQSAWASLSQEARRKQLLYHFVRPAMSIPGQLKAGRLPTLLQGHDLTVAVTPSKEKGGVPVVTIKPEVGAPVKVYIFNVYAARSVMQGVDGSIQAKLPAVTAESAPRAGSGRHLLAAADIMASTSSTRRSLLRRIGRVGDAGFNQATANSIAATNTQYAIEAAANGDIPVGAATAYGSYQADAASSYYNRYDNCYNCGRRWRG